MHEQFSKSYVQGGSRGPAFGRQDLQNSHSKKSVPVEESSKLNLLIDEYRRENDRCS